MDPADHRSGFRLSAGTSRACARASPSPWRLWPSSWRRLRWCRADVEPGSGGGPGDREAAHQRGGSSPTTPPARRRRRPPVPAIRALRRESRADLRARAVGAPADGAVVSRRRRGSREGRGPPETGPSGWSRGARWCSGVPACDVAAEAFRSFPRIRPLPALFTMSAENLGVCYQTARTTKTHCPSCRDHPETRWSPICDDKVIDLAAHRRAPAGRRPARGQHSPESVTPDPPCRSSAPLWRPDGRLGRQPDAGRPVADRPDAPARWRSHCGTSSAARRRISSGGCGRARATSRPPGRAADDARSPCGRRSSGRRRARARRPPALQPGSLTSTVWPRTGYMPLSGTSPRADNPVQLTTIPRAGSADSDIRVRVPPAAASRRTRYGR